MHHVIVFYQNNLYFLKPFCKFHFILLLFSLTFRSNRSFDVQPQSNSSSKLNPIRVPHSNAFLDLTGDYTAGLFSFNDVHKGPFPYSLLYSGQRFSR